MTWPALAGVHTIAFDFDGVFTDNKVYVTEEGKESVRCDRADGLGIDMLRAATQKGMLRADIFILSKERNPVTLARAKKLQLTCHAGCDDKVAFMQRRIRDFAGVIYVGNDLNDLALMRLAGFSVAPSDAHEQVQRIASVVLPKRGGEGFVRAFVEKLLDIDNLASEVVHELVHHR